MFGATPVGFIKKSEPDILLDLRQNARLPEFFGENVDLSDGSVVDIFIRLFAKSFSENWDAMESAFYNAYLDTAEGINLDRLAGLIGIIRKIALKEQVTIQFTGSSFTVIPLGFLVQSIRGVVFVTNEELTLSNLGTGSVLAVAQLAGLTNRVESNELTEIVTPIANLDSCNNAEPSGGGGELESDAELRARIRDFVASDDSVGDNIRAKILKDIDIKSCNYVENPYSTVQNGMPEHSLHFLIEGASNLKIAELLFKYKPEGIELIGDISVNYLDSETGQTALIKFSRPQYLDLFFKITILSKADWIVDNIESIKIAIAKRIGGTYTAPDSTITEYKLSGQSLITSFEFYKDFQSISGIVDLEILFGSSLIDRTHVSVSVPGGYVGRVDSTNIEVIVT